MTRLLTTQSKKEGGSFYREGNQWLSPVYGTTSNKVATSLRQESDWKSRLQSQATRLKCQLHQLQHGLGQVQVHSLCAWRSVISETKITLTPASQKYHEECHSSNLMLGILYNELDLSFAVEIPQIHPFPYMPSSKGVTLSNLASYFALWAFIWS